MARANNHYVPAVADPLSPVTFVHKIKVPVYLACQFTDEQTGGHCPDLAEHFTGTAHKWFTFTNGVHVDSLDPDTFTRWYDFLELFVAHQRPSLSPGVKLAGADDLLDRDGDRRHRPPERSDSEPADLRRGARRVREAAAGAGAVRQRRGAPRRGRLSRVRALVLALPGPGDRGPLVVPGTERIARERTAGPGRAANVCLEQARRPRDRLHRRYRRRRALGGDPDLQLGPEPARHLALVPERDPCSRNTVVFGAGALQAWIKASTPDVDLQVTVSEVRPDGKETFVQNGWLRASDRKLDPRQSTLLEPVPTLRASDVAPLPKGRFTKVTVPLYYEGHAYRAGSRIRITIAAPNGSQPMWSFAETRPKGHATRVGGVLAPSSPRAWCCRSCPGWRCPPRCLRARGCAGSRAAPTGPRKRIAADRRVALSGDMLNVPIEAFAGQRGTLCTRFARHPRTPACLPDQNPPGPTASRNR